MTDQPWQNLEPDSLSTNKLLSDYFYQIPPNQREYKWKTKEQLRRFWDDLTSCISKDLPSSSAPVLGHFFGTIVVIGDKQPTSSDRHKVIDGQQRITTITLLARVLLEFVEDEHTDSGKKQSLSTKLLSCVTSHQDDPPILTTMTHPPVAVVIV